MAPVPRAHKYFRIPNTLAGKYNHIQTFKAGSAGKDRSNLAKTASSTFPNFMVPKFSS